VQVFRLIKLSKTGIPAGFNPDAARERITSKTKKNQEALPPVQAKKNADKDRQNSCLNW